MGTARTSSTVRVRGAAGTSVASCILNRDLPAHVAAKGRKAACILSALRDRVARRFRAAAVRRLAGGLIVLGLCAASTAVGQTSSDPSRELGLSTETSSRFSASGNCAFCHISGADVLTTSEGKDVSPVHGWRGSLMAHAAHDPFWRASVRREGMLAGDPAAVEHECARCHAPAQHHEAERAGTRFELARLSELGADGVTCSVCHQIGPEGLGSPATYSGHFVIDGSSREYGPYEDPVRGPMRNIVDFTPEYGPHMSRSDLCGTCHTLFTPVHGRDGAAFPEQTPYLEWRSSAYAAQEVHCQDCHMPAVHQSMPVSLRPPWIEPRPVVWEHHFPGAGVAPVRALAGVRDGTGAAGHPLHADSSLLTGRISELEEFTRSSVSLQIRAAVDGDTLRGWVDVENHTGHKLPTGFPARRMWLRVIVRDDGGKVLFESGAVDARGVIADEDARMEAHHVELGRPGNVQIYESRPVDARGDPTHVLLRAAGYGKDNRIPPLGFPSAAMRNDTIGVHGVASDPDFNAESCGCDRVALRIPLPVGSAAVTVEADLLYQSFRPAYLEHLELPLGTADPLATYGSMPVLLASERIRASAAAR